MFRKTLITLAATAALSAAAFVPTSASAHGIHLGGGWGHGFGFRGIGITVLDPGYSCWQYQTVKVGRRTYERQLVNVCN